MTTRDRLTIDLLQRALDQTGALIEGVQPDQLSQPTPCQGWDLRTLLNHIVFDLRTFVSMLDGSQRPSPDTDFIGQDWVGAYRSEAASLVAAWQARGTGGTMRLPWAEVPMTWAVGQNLADIAVHGWDVARATDQAAQLDPEIGEVGLDWGRENLKPEFRGQAFGPEVPVPAEAPVYDRLAGFFGRQPTAD